MDKRIFIILVLLLQFQIVYAIGGHRYRMALSVSGNCTNEPVLVTATNEVNERPVERADVDVFLIGKKVFNLETNETGKVLFLPAKAGSYLIQVDRDGYLRAETTVNIAVCGTVSTTSTTITISATSSTTSTTILPTTTVTTTIPTTTIISTTIEPTSTTPVGLETTLEAIITVPAGESTLPAAKTEGVNLGLIFIVILIILGAVIALAALLLSKKIKL